MLKHEAGCTDLNLRNNFLHALYHQTYLQQYKISPVVFQNRSALCCSEITKKQRALSKVLLEFLIYEFFVQKDPALNIFIWRRWAKILITVGINCLKF